MEKFDFVTAALMAAPLILTIVIWTCLANAITALELENNKLKRIVKKLCDYHVGDSTRGIQFRLDSGFSDSWMNDLPYFKEHNRAVITKKAGAVTLGELARLVIDGEPIKRASTDMTEITAACCGEKEKE